MRRFLITFGWCVLWSASMGQTAEQFLAYLDTTRHDTMQIHVNIGLGYVQGSAPQAQPYLERAMALCEELSHAPEPVVRKFAETSLPQVLNLLALHWQRREDHVRAMALFRRALEHYELLRDTAGVILIENNLALLFQKVGDRTGALHHFRAALTLARAHAEPMWPASLMARIGTLYVEMGQLDSADVYLNESLKDRVSSSLDYRYRNQALLREKQGRIGEAVALLDSSIALSRSARNDLIMGTASLQFARLLKTAGRPQAALVALDSCLAYFKGREQVFYCQCLQAHGALLLDMGRPAPAEQDLVRALAVAREAGQPRTQLLATASLRDLYRRTGRFALALDLADQWQALDDSIDAMDARTELLSMDFLRTMRNDSIANATEKERLRQVSEARLERERTRRNIFLFSGIGLLVFGLVVFRQRNRIKKEHARSEELLLNILPEEVAEELKTKGHADAKHFDNVTILFTDFKGFTAMSERLSPQELVEELNTCFKAFDGIITARGIEKIKTIGDAYMCAGGLPDPKTSSCADVVQAALEMQAFMSARKAERDARNELAFEMRVGMHTGPVVAGIVGVKKFQYDIWGDTVNIASRMESSGEVGQVNISEATYALVKDEPSFTFTPRGKVQAKGKGELEMYFVRPG